jgi:dCTP deaminase
MILSDGGLKKLIDSGELVIEPMTPESIQPASVDCRLGDHFLVVAEPETTIISMSQEIRYKEVIADKIVIAPHSFLLATTMEYIKLPNNMVSFVEGRSSIGRMGLFIQNAGWVDPGFEGKITLELYNANSFPIELEAGRRICQLVFGLMDSPALNPYRGKYQGQSKSVGSKVWKDSENTTN